MTDPSQPQQPPTASPATIDHVAYYQEICRQILSLSSEVREMKEKASDIRNDLHDAKSAANHLCNRSIFWPVLGALIVWVCIPFLFWALVLGGLATCAGLGAAGARSASPFGTRP